MTALPGTVSVINPFLEHIKSISTIHTGKQLQLYRRWAEWFVSVSVFISSSLRCHAHFYPFFHVIPTDSIHYVNFTGRRSPTNRCRALFHGFLTLSAADGKWFQEFHWPIKKRLVEKVPITSSTIWIITTQGGVASIAVYPIGILIWRTFMIWCKITGAV